MKSLQSSIVVLAFVLALTSCRSSTSPPSRLREGNWGGNHVGVLVEATQVTFLFDCAGGIVNGPIPLAADGTFDVTGTFSDNGNAFNVDHTPHATRYTGRLTGNQLTFTRVVLDGSRPDATFSAELGAAWTVIAC